MMRSQGAEFIPPWPAKPRLSAKQPVVIAANDSFRIRGDGPKRSGEDLLRLSGVSTETWFLIEDATGKRVPSSITADAGGHTCRYGVGFNFEPKAPLAVGSYTLVLLLGKSMWKLIEDDEASHYKGQRAIVRRHRVVDAAPPSETDKEQTTTSTPSSSAPEPELAERTGDKSFVTGSRVCDDYVFAYERLAQCDSLPEAARKSTIDGVAKVKEMLATSYASSDEEARRKIEDSCRISLEALVKAAGPQGCKVQP